MNRSEFESVVAAQYRGTTIVRMVTVQLPLRHEIHAAILHDEHGRFAVGCQGDDVVRVGVKYIEDAIGLYLDAIEECELFIRELGGEPPAEGADPGVSRTYA